MGLTYAMRNNAFSEALRHAAKRKKAFDKHISPTEFQVGDLVQRYDSRLDETHSSMRKLAPRWSGPLRIVGRSTNSYRLEDLHGNHFSSATHTRLLRPFIPRPGTTLATYNEALRLARKANPEATKPTIDFASENLPPTPRPEARIPLDRDDPTQPDNHLPQVTRLWEAFTEEWECIDAEVIKNLYYSMPLRVAEHRDARGNNITTRLEQM
ncbi:Retrovirus-related Pol polyprotein from transposon opus [Ceratobasidium sp. AG-Ba]|nr:Retrovirus-related Pol polyprotein from transposon opus [Ceratobasidium sp. AG-Ba]